MYQVYLKNSARTGLPEFWGYEESSAECLITFGSLFKSGKQVQKKQSGYGRSNVSKKLSNGYQFVCSADAIDIDNASQACQGTKSKLSQAAFEIYASAMNLVSRPVDSSLRTTQNSSASTASVPKAPVQRPAPTQRPPQAPSVPAPSTSTFLLPGVPQDAGNNAWAW